MNKSIAIVLFSFVLQAASAQEAGIRPYTEAELKRWSFVCEGLKKAMPVSYKDYKVTTSDCGSFDWSERDTKGNPLTVYNKQNQPTGNRPFYNVNFKMDEDSSDYKEKLIQADLLQGQKADGTFDSKIMAVVSAKSDKFIQSHNPAITVVVNWNVAISKPYEVSTKPIKLALPVPAFAYLYTVPDGKTAGNDADEIAYDNTTVYRDKAIVVLCAKGPKVVSTKVSGKGTLREEVITPLDGAEQSLVPVKNIVVQIDGYEKDVRALMEKIDWKALQALLGK